MKNSVMRFYTRVESISKCEMLILTNQQIHGILVHINLDNLHITMKILKIQNIEM